MTADGPSQNHEGLILFRPASLYVEPNDLMLSKSGAPLDKDHRLPPRAHPGEGGGEPDDQEFLEGLLL